MDMEESISLQNKDKIDNVLAYVFIKKLIRPINTTKAFKLGLIDNEGKLLKEPETDEEQRSLSLFDRIVFKIKRMLGSRVSQLNAFIYLKSLDDDFYNNMVITGSLSKKSAVRRMEKDIENVLEKYDIRSDELFKMLISEQYRNKDK
jgi:hypothetical protein